MVYVIKLFWDKEADVWVAINDDLPLALESESVENLMDRVKLAVPELLELNKMITNKSVTLSFVIECKL